MNPIIYGYQRVSTQAQHLDRQFNALKEFGVEEQNIFADKLSGKDFNRTEYQRMLSLLNPGDTLVIKAIDRLGRNYAEVNENWRILTKEKGVFMVVLDMPLLDTRAKKEDITSTLIADLVLQILSYFADCERQYIIQRSKEGLAAAKAKGVQLGRPVIPLPDDFAKVKAAYDRKEISVRAVARKYDVSPWKANLWLNDEQNG